MKCVTKPRTLCTIGKVCDFFTKGLCQNPIFSTYSVNLKKDSVVPLNLRGKIKNTLSAIYFFCKALSDSPKATRECLSPAAVLMTTSYVKYY